MTVTIGGPASGPLATAPRPVALSESSCAILLETARHALQDAVHRGRPGVARTPTELPPELEATSDAFVTITRRGVLRGCMGVLGAGLPTWLAVASAAGSAAIHDPRFRSVEPAELPGLHLDVSVLGPPVELPDPAAFRPGTDGIIVERGGRRALLLPEVATEAGWSAHEMLEAVCRKAGLAGDSWSQPGTRLLVFRTLRFGGPVVAPTEVHAGA